MLYLVLSPINILFASIGRNGSTPITVHTFTQPYILDFGLNVVQTSSTVLTGTEGYAIVRFLVHLHQLVLIIQFRNLFKHYTLGLRLECDNDGDGIPNGFDLDSDNDGIYDLKESGSNPNLDLDNNGNH
jgi:hypothetical protein